jgi:hypothetical protein
MTLEINDKSVKFGFGLYFLGKAQKKFNTDLQGLLSSIVKNPLSDIVDLMYYSIVVESELDELEAPITKREFITYLESVNDYGNTDGLLAKWSNKFIESIKGNFLPEGTEKEEDAVKKK